MGHGHFFELRGTENELIGLFVDRAGVLVVAREVLLSRRAARATVILQRFDRRSTLVGEELIATKHRASR